MNTVPERGQQFILFAIAGSVRECLEIRDESHVLPDRTRTRPQKSPNHGDHRHQ